jgi:PleD family two-component response regulator
LALFHHDPTHDDTTVAGLETTARERVAARGGSLQVFAAAERLEVDVHGQGRSVDMPDVSAIRRPPVAGKRVLVVSSSETDIATIGQLLAEDNLVLLPTSDKQTALSCASDILPDLAIIDGQLPDGDGATLIEPLRARLDWPDFPIILLTEGPDPAAD